MVVASVLEIQDHVTTAAPGLCSSKMTACDTTACKASVLSQTKFLIVHLHAVRVGWDELPVYGSQLTHHFWKRLVDEEDIVSYPT